MKILGTVASSKREVPGAPTIGTATNVGTARAYNNGAATVTFTAPASTGGLPITSYIVTSNTGGYTGTGSASPITVTGLQSSASYTFTVRAVNSAGQGAASAASNSITATTVPQAPTIGTATAGNTTATVTYTAGATGGAAVSAYIATSSPGGQTGSGASPITVSGLTNGTAYTFTMTATNINGTSLASAASNSVTPIVPVPNAPTIGTATNTPSGRAYNNGAASVTFTPAVSGPVATSYTVTSSPGGYTASAASSPITVTGLQSNTAYTFTVKANNASGSSVASSASNSITATTVPQAPTIGTVSVSSRTVVSVPYTDNATGGSAITSRTIASSPSISLSYSAGSSPVAVTGSYAASQGYTFTITATNANGTSTASGTSNSVTPYVPIAPTITSLTFTNTGSTTGTLSWTGTNIDVWMYEGDPSAYPPPFNYGTFTSSWPGNLINLVSGTSYSVTIYVRSVDNLQAQRSLTFTKP
jgi:hypothetical protein